MDDLQTKPCKHKVYLFFATAYLMMLLQPSVFMYTDKTIKTKIIDIGKIFYKGIIGK